MRIVLLFTDPRFVGFLGNIVLMQMVIVAYSAKVVMK